MEKGIGRRFARTVSEEDLTQEDMTSQPATAATTTTTTTTASATGAESANAVADEDSSEDEAVFVDCLLPTDNVPLATKAAASATPSCLPKAPRRATRAVSAAISAAPTIVAETADVAATVVATATAAADVAGTTSIPSGAARRAPRVPPTHLPNDLPATAAEVTDLASLSRVVSLLSTIIVKAIHDGKSVTASNKRLIVVAAEETRRAMAAFQRLPTSTTEPTCIACALTPVGDFSFTPTSQAPPLIADSKSATNSVQHDLVQCVREEMTKLKSEIITSVANVVRPTYAQMLAIKTHPTTFAASATMPATAKRTSEPPTSPMNRPAIVVTPRGNITTRQEAVAAWRSSISFKNSKYAPSRVKPISNNKLRIEFEAKDHRDDVLERLRNSEVVSAEPARGLQPMVILKGITKETPSEELCSIIREQNPSLGDPGDGLKLRFIRRNRNASLYNAVLITDTQTWRKIVDLGRINVDHQKVHAENFSPFMQCFSCLQFGHGSRHCQQSSVKPCAYCAETTHRESECPTKAVKGSPKCYNCDSRNKKFENHDPINHTATSQSCPVLRTMKARVEERINYV